jgi:predicted naringenin-chalcone synthase
MHTLLSRFSMKRPPHQTSQAAALAWLARAHAAAEGTVQSWDPARVEAFHARLERVIDRCACGPTKIGSRGHVVADAETERWSDMVLYDVVNHPHGRGTTTRNAIYADVVSRYFEREYEGEDTAPSDIIHVTCTGYVSPSGAQRVVQRKGWGALTRVTHAYHMGCYAAFPATRLAMGSLFSDAAAGRRGRRVDVVHTELCSLHLDPSDHSVEQLVVQSLFADGFIRYAVSADDGPGLRVLALDERILPDSADSMGWALSDWGMKMTLARDVPERIGAALRAFVVDLYAKAEMSLGAELGRTVFAVHPGGPKIIDAVRDVLELRDAQVETSRSVLFDYGNMSSATLPHVWMRILDDPSIARGTPILSLAFGPGLTICGGIFRKQ